MSGGKIHGSASINKSPPSHLFLSSSFSVDRPPLIRERMNFGLITTGPMPKPPELHIFVYIAAWPHKVHYIRKNSPCLFRIHNGFFEKWNGSLELGIGCMISALVSYSSEFIWSCIQVSGQVKLAQILKEFTWILEIKVGRD